MSHPLEAFASSLDLDASKVINSPSLILLCGGPVDTKLGADPSLRALFNQRLKENHPDLFKRVLLAEEANEWVRIGNHYNNLFELEHDLASLSAVILVFVESPGSIAELGAFCQAPPLREKLVAILEHSHQDDTSFIKAGPVEFLRSHNNHASSVHFLPWLRRANKYGKRRLLRSAARETVIKFARWLSEYMASLPKEEKFRNDKTGHHQLLIADSISLCTIVLKKDIASFLKGLTVKIASQELDKYLFLLEKLRLIGRNTGTTRTTWQARQARNMCVMRTRKREGLGTDDRQVLT